MNKDIIVMLLCAAGYDYDSLMSMPDNKLSQLMDDVEYNGKE
jgi:hypothetical protein